MNFAGLGIGANAFMQGLESGVRTGRTLRDVIRENNMEDLRKQGMEEARQKRAAEVEGAITTDQPTQPSQPEQAPTQPDTQAAPDTSAQPTTPAAEPTPVTPESQPSPAASTVAADRPKSITQPTPTQSVASGGMPGANPEPQAPAAPAEQKPTGKFFVGGKGYNTREEAYKAADAKTPDVINFFMKAVPHMQQQYIENGDFDKADALGKWAQNRKNQDSMNAWSKMLLASEMGDPEKAADHAFELYKRLDDGVTPISKTVVKDKDGNVTGFNIRLQDDVTKEKRDQFISNDQLINMGAVGLSPEKLFEVEYSRQAAAAKLKAEAAVKAQERKDKLADDLTVEDRKAKNARELEGVRGANKAVETNITQDRLDARERIKSDLGIKAKKAEKQGEIDTKIDALLGAGYGEDDVKKMMPTIVGAIDTKKTTSPAERRALIVSDLTKNDATFARLPPDQQRKKVDDMMGVIGAEGGEEAPKPKGASVEVSPTAMKFDPKLKVVYRKSDGQPFHVTAEGKYVPISGGVPKQ